MELRYVRSLHFSLLFYFEEKGMLKQQKVYEMCFKTSFNFLNLGRFRGMAVVSLFLLLAFIVSACGSSASAGKSTSESTHTITSNPDAFQSTSTPQFAVGGQSTTMYRINVYFSRVPQSNDNFGAVFPVKRLSSTSSIGTFSIEQLVAGPTAAEHASGYFSEIENHLVGTSNCPPSSSNSNFTLSLNTKGSTSEQGTATLKFCHQFASAGVGTDARAIAEINATLKQFPAIKKVVILTKDSHCFGDESGADMCLR